MRLSGSLLVASLAIACGQAHPSIDAGADAGSFDGGPPDAGVDAGQFDGGVGDAGPPDAGTLDAGPADGGAPDAGHPMDGGPADAGSPDAGTYTVQDLLAYLATLPDSGILTGQYADYTIDAGEDELHQIATIIQDAGQTPAILGVYFSLQGFEKPADPVALSNDWLADGGIVLGMFSPGNPSHSPDIIGGDTQGPDAGGFPINWTNLVTPGTTEYANWYGDGGLNALIGELKQINGPILLRMFPEFDRDEWWGVPYRTPAQFVQLWQGTVTYLRASVDNVAFVYNVGCGSLPVNPTSLIDDNYPGDAYVDVVSLDCYPPSTVQNPPATHDNTAAIAALTALGSGHKPVIYAEIGAVKGNLPVPLFSGNTDTALQTIIDNFPQVVGVCVWPGTEALSEQLGMVQFMTNPSAIDLGDLPKH